MKQKKMFKRAKAKIQERFKSLHFRELLGTILLLLIIVSMPAKTAAVVVYFYDGGILGDRQILVEAQKEHFLIHNPDEPEPNL